MYYELTIIGRTILIILICIITFLIFIKNIFKHYFNIAIIFLLVLLFLGIRSFFEPSSPLWYLFSFFLNISTGNLLYVIGKKGLPKLWNTTMAILFLILLCIYFLGFFNRLNFAVFSLLVVAGASTLSIYLLWQFYFNKKQIIFLLLFISVCFLLLAACFELYFFYTWKVSFQISLWVSIVILIEIAVFFLNDDSFLYYTLFNYVNKKNIIKDDNLARIQQAEHLLYLQDRLISSGYLAAGIFHEFKNVLSNVSLLLDYGLEREETTAKNKSLLLIKENIDIAFKYVMSLLESLSLGGRPEPKHIDLKEFLNNFFQTIRANYAKTLIHFEFDLRCNLKPALRKAELEQVLINLIRNSVTAFEQNPVKYPLIKISVYAKDEFIVFDTVDNAGGIPEDLLYHMFEPPKKTGKNGLGLYLTAKIVSLNNGTIEYLPQDNGSLFRIIFEKKILH